MVWTGAPKRRQVPHPAFGQLPRFRGEGERLVSDRALQAVLGPDGSDLVVARELAPLGFPEGRFERGFVHGAERHRRFVVTRQLEENACDERILRRRRERANALHGAVKKFSHRPFIALRVRHRKSLRFALPQSTIPCLSRRRLRRAALKPSVALSLHRDAVRAAAARFRSANPRVFGSALSGADEEGSDLDLLVDPLPGATLFDLGALQVELTDILGVPVDLLTPGDLPLKVRAKVLAEAQPV